MRLRRWTCALLLLSLTTGCGPCEPEECEDYCSEEHPGGEAQLETCRLECIEACGSAEATEPAAPKMLADSEPSEPLPAAFEFLPIDRNRSPRPGYFQSEAKRR